jgi:DNA uptake protein ComE-like DNA-binding protein
MALASRRQLILGLLAVAAASTGLGAQHWRQRHPYLAESLEAFDHTPPAWRATTTGRDRPGSAGPRAGTPAAATRPIDVNRAPAERLVSLPGVGPVLAARITEARPFATVDDLRRVRGLGAARLARLRPLVTVHP